MGEGFRSPREKGKNPPFGRKQGQNVFVYVFYNNPPPCVSLRAKGGGNLRNGFFWVGGFFFLFWKWGWGGEEHVDTEIQ